MSQLNHVQRLDIVQQSLAAAEKGNRQESIKIIQQLPLAPHLAKAAKEAFGADYLKKSGFDLSAAEVAYGHNWLNQ